MDINSWITSALDGGTSAEDLAKQFAAALNKAEADRNGEKERTEFLALLLNGVNQVVKNVASITSKTVADVATIAIANKDPELRKADLEEIRTSLLQLTDLIDAIASDDTEAVMRQLGSRSGKRVTTPIVKVQKLDADAILKKFLNDVGLS